MLFRDRSVHPPVAVMMVVAMMMPPVPVPMVPPMSDMADPARAVIGPHHAADSRPVVAVVGRIVVGGSIIGRPVIAVYARPVVTAVKAVVASAEIARPSVEARRAIDPRAGVEMPSAAVEPGSNRRAAAESAMECRAATETTAMESADAWTAAMAEMMLHLDRLRCGGRADRFRCRRDR